MPEPKKSDFEKSNLRPQFVPTKIKIQEIKSIGNAVYIYLCFDVLMKCFY